MGVVMISFFSFPGLCLALLFLVGAEDAQGLTVYNAGVNGSTTRGALLRFDDEVAARTPDICLIAFGMNDSMNEVNPVLPDDYRANLLWLANHCAEEDIQPVFITVNPVNQEMLYERHDPPYYEEQGGPNAIIELYNQGIKDVAAQVGADVIDWHARVMELSGTSIEPGSVLRPDGVHLSPDGLNALGNLVADWILAEEQTNATIVAFGDSITKQGWIDIAAVLCSPSGQTTYTSDISSSLGHPDTVPPFRLLDGQWVSIVSHSVEYAGDPEIVFTLPQTREVEEVEVCSFSKGSYALAEVAVDISTDGNSWVQVGSQLDIPQQVLLSDLPAKLMFTVNRPVLKIRVRLVRANGSTRVLLSEVFVR